MYKCRRMMVIFIETAVNRCICVDRLNEHITEHPVLTSQHTVSTNACRQKVYTQTNSTHFRKGEGRRCKPVISARSPAVPGPRANTCSNNCSQRQPVTNRPVCRGCSRALLRTRVISLANGQCQVEVSFVDPHKLL